MKKRWVSAGLSLLLLSGCAGHQTTLKNGDQALFQVGDKKVTKNQVYDLLKTNDGGSVLLSKVQDAIATSEVKVTKAMKKKAEDTLKSYESEENFEANLKASGYTKDSYLKKVILPGLQAQALNEQYFTDNKKGILKKYKPSQVIILQMDNEKTAKKALKAIKAGKNFDDIYQQYSTSSSTWSNTKTLITTETSTLPTRLIKQAYAAKSKGVIDEVFKSDDDNSTMTYLVNVISNDYKTLKDDLISNLSSGSTFTTEVTTYYLKKGQFSIHDQTVFDALRASHPEMLVMFPELANESTTN